MELDFVDFVIGKKIIAENFINWTSGNEIIDNFIQEKQLKYDGRGKVFEWVPYNELIITDGIEDNCLTAAIWEGGPLYYLNDDDDDDDRYYGNKGDNVKNVWLRRTQSVVLRFLYDSQNITADFINKIESHLSNCEKDDDDMNNDSEYRYYIYGISQNPNTKVYILIISYEYISIYCKKCGNKYNVIYYEFCIPCLMNKSGNEKIDNFIQERHLKYDRKTAFEWISYNEFNIKEIRDNCLTTAIWKDGPLCYDNKKWIRKSYKRVTLRFLYNLQNITDKFINKVESYLSEYKENRIYEISQIYGISQNPDTKIYILVFDEKYSHYYCEKCGVYRYDNKWCKSCHMYNRTSGNKKIDNFIQSKFTVYGWIPYNEFIYIKEIEDNCLSTAIWKKDPICYNADNEKLIRESYETVYLQYLYNSPDISDEFLNGVESFFKNGRCYGISQNPDTQVYILVFDDKYLDECCINCGNKYKYDKYDDKWCRPCQINHLKNNFANWTSGNKKIDNFIYEKQIEIFNYRRMIFEWIPYNRFIEVNKIDRESEFAKAILEDSPLFYDRAVRKLIRESYNEVVYLKYLHNSKNNTDKLLDEIELYLKVSSNICGYGISQDPDTEEYILVFDNFSRNKCETCGNEYKNKKEWCKACQLSHLKNNFTNWTSGNEQVDEFIQKMQLRIKYNDTIFEWIPYDEFINIKEIGKNVFAIWKDGLLRYSERTGQYKRELNKKVLLKYLYNSQNINNAILNEIAHSIKESYGISQDPNTKDFILVLQPKYYCENCGKKYDNKFEIDNKSCILCQINHENDKINGLIQEMRLNIQNSEESMIFEWIPYDQFNDIEEISKGDFFTDYSAIWEDGLLCFNDNGRRGGVWKRRSNTRVTLKCMHNSQNFLDNLINEVKAYPNQIIDNILKLYGISQNPKTKDYIIVLEYIDDENLNDYFNKGLISLDWRDGINILIGIINVLSKIHQKKLAHRNFHSGNILLFKNYISHDYEVYISDIGFYKKIDDNDKTNIYGVMPYVAPEVLKGKPYTQAADVYSFGMIMYVVAAGRQPFADCAHDETLALNICNGIRPEINDQIAPMCYIKLMKKCWNSNPGNRPNSIEIKEMIKSFRYNNRQFEETEEYRKQNLLSIKNNRPKIHTQAIYTSRLLNPFTKNLSKYDK
ncbi:hypothetical protein RclHR1_00430007 [Rhizophagus clarus]|uniref:Protein kinase domain-containing protein n=1 Tax=Rhizophagus clarus TaxID=94130 RepID=A0A2Z6RXM0_9GLOM|nr:hypothetical protein RclHR1_00430007 [Rhizophagus clarus]